MGSQERRRRWMGFVFCTGGADKGFCLPPRPPGLRLTEPGVFCILLLCTCVFLPWLPSVREENIKHQQMSWVTRVVFSTRRFLEKALLLYKIKVNILSSSPDFPVRLQGRQRSIIDKDGLWQGVDETVRATEKQ